MFYVSNQGRTFAESSKFSCTNRGGHSSSPGEVRSRDTGLAISGIGKLLEIPYKVLWTAAFHK
jgi:hypothetical protein